ncbi:MAG: large conductance mechanosensitive channel protein MscL [Trueperella sp.]|uniref:large conductance mechanosensitive channel protein MscL n=1 Tax=Trueperella sp. TaxID=2699835 RepID=UPI0025D130FC|nr:large conductance mechanosensitive channel protein MscL [Trueperella sp.]MCI7304902.1 large conductance mechanosensitive channel protein MscL [Trueperella sp.]
MLKGFKEFISRGNVLDLAVGVIIATAFSAIVKALNEEILMPLIGAIFGKPNFDHIWTININGAKILPGTLITTTVNFLIVAAAIYFFIIVPINRLKKPAEPVEETPVKTDEAVLLEEIRDLLARQQN